LILFPSKYVEFLILVIIERTAARPTLFSVRQAPFFPNLGVILIYSIHDHMLNSIHVWFLILQIVQHTAARPSFLFSKSSKILIHSICIIVLLYSYFCLVRSCMLTKFFVLTQGYTEAKFGS
jgi:hypothetical protein